MININGGTKLSPHQLQLNRIFSVERVLSSRGFSIKTEGNGEDTILNKSSWTQNEADQVFSVFNNATSRKELLRYIEDNVAKAGVSEPVNNIIEINGFIKDRHRFSTTFEWYVGELLVRKFMAFSSSYGVTIDDICRNSDNGKSGDFDVLSVLGDMNLLYLECKSGKTKQGSIKKTFERSISLHCTAAIFIQDNFNERNLKQQLSFSHPLFGCSADVYKLNIKNLHDSTIYKWFNCYFVDASNGNVDIENKLRAVLRIIEASRSVINMSTEPDVEQYEQVGYEFTKL